MEEGSGMTRERSDEYYSMIVAMLMNAYDVADRQSVINLPFTELNHMGERQKCVLGGILPVESIQAKIKVVQI